MKIDHCDWCDVLVDKYNGVSITGSISVKKWRGGKNVSFDIKTAATEEGAWCSLDHLMEWLQKGLDVEEKKPC